MKNNVRTRNANMELLRILAIYFVVMLHLLGKTSAIDELTYGTFTYYVVWIMENICKIGNSVLIVISGYFYVDTKFKTYKLLNLWIQTYFYSVIFAFVAHIMGIGLASGWEKVLFPIISSEYWFITVYLVLYCLTPYIKIFVQKC